MRLYLSANTKTGYTPDWIQIEYADEDTNQTVELTMDIHGEIDYNPETLNVRVKGELVPWMLYTDTNETNLSELSEQPAKQYEELFNKYINDASNITIGFYPVTNNYESDNINTTPEEFNNSRGEYHYIENGKLKQLVFTFNGEIND